ncbi:Cyclin N domain containing protein [Trichuris trichiura]|uniref:Cyclin N domain containing protein n=1 Tax=Trichuris trichiura TaxID=36087 RepID=A0A077Z6N7_TRITR|nr:Cyclin N domain containing protein [Trichuris trichiura]
MRRLKAEGHYLSVAGGFLRNIGVQGCHLRPLLPAEKPETKVRPHTEEEPQLSRAICSQVELELSLEEDNMFERALSRSPSAFLSRSQRSRQYTKDKQRISEVFSYDVLMPKASGTTSGDNDLLESRSSEFAGVGPPFKLSCLSSADSLVGRRLAIVFRGVPAVVFSIIPAEPFYCQRRHHTLSKTSECSESPGLRPSFEGVHLAGGSHAIQSTVSQSAQSSVSFMEHLNPSPIFRKYRQAVFPSLTGSQFDLFGNWDTIAGGELSSLLLDDTEFKSRGHKTTLTFASYMTSIIDYADPSDVKRENNEKFKYNIKREMRAIATDSEMELAMLAQAVSYFDQCILKGLIDKTNRKYLAGVCLVLSAKLNDFKGTKLRALLDNVEERFRLWRVDLFKYELPVAVALEFALHLPPVVIAAHYQKLAWES